MTPLEEGVSINIGQNFAAIWRPCGFFFKFIFYYVHIFAKKMLNWYQMHIKKIYKYLAEKSLSVFKKAPFEQTMNFLRKMFFFF